MPDTTRRPVAVDGAEGFLGRAVARALVGQGVAVRAVVADPGAKAPTGTEVAPLSPSAGAVVAPFSPSAEAMTAPSFREAGAEGESPSWPAGRGRARPVSKRAMRRNLVMAIPP